MAFDGFQSGPELSTDLEWLLQSEQTHTAAISQALVNEFWAPLYRLAFATLDHPDKAAWASVRILVISLAKVYTYRGDLSPRAWFFRLALNYLESAQRQQKLNQMLKILGQPPGQHQAVSSGHQPQAGPLRFRQALNALPEPLRLTLLLRQVLDWPLNEIAQTLNLTGEAVLVALQAAHRQFEANLLAAGGWQGESEWETALAGCWPAAALTPADLEGIAAAAQADASRLAVRRQRAVHWREALLVAGVAVVVLGLWWGANTLFPEPDRPPLTTQATGILTPVATPGLRFTYLVEPGDTLGSISRSLGLSPAELSELNSLKSDQQPGQWTELALPDLKPPWEIRWPNPTLIVTAPPVSFDRNTTPDQIRQLMENGQKYWQTLWVEYQTTVYGWPGYVGPALYSQRSQVWARQPGYRVILSGSDDSIRTNYAVISIGRFEYSFHKSRYLQVNVRVIQEDELGRDVEGLIYPYRSEMMRVPGNVKVLETTNFSGRETVVVDWEPSARRLLPGNEYYRERLWLDVQTGVVLRSQTFQGQAAETLISETEATQVSFNGNLPPPSFFDPRSGHLDVFARDAQGEPMTEEALAAQLAQKREPAAGHEPLEKVLPPPGFDPASQFLTFQYPPATGSDTQEAQTRRLPRVDLFAGGYYLGQIEFARPDSITCDRSADGSRVAFLGQPMTNQPEYYLNSVQFGWFSLHNPAKTHLIDLEMIPQDLAFAPDGRQVALSGFQQNTGQGELVLVDLTTEEVRLLQTTDYFPDSLVWKPDGQFLAYLVYSPDGSQPIANILDVATGEVVSTQTVPADSGAGPNSESQAKDWPSLDWPAQTWGVEFPVERSWLDGCTAPPKSPP